MSQDKNLRNEEKYEKEANRMEDVFRRAYERLEDKSQEKKDTKHKD